MFRIFLLTLQLVTIALAVCWAYTSYKYNCLNVGPCYEIEGSSAVNLWIDAGDIAMSSFLLSLIGLFIITFRFSLAPVVRRAKAIAWAIAIFAPPFAFYLAYWWFHRGFPLSPV